MVVVKMISMYSEVVTNTPIFHMSVCVCTSTKVSLFRSSRRCKVHRSLSQNKEVNFTITLHKFSDFYQ